MAITLKPFTKTFLSDTITPVSAYLRLRDRFPGSFLLESNDYGQNNNKSFICLQPIAKLTKAETESKITFNDEVLADFSNVDMSNADMISEFTSHFEFTRELKDATNSIFGYCTSEVPGKAYSDTKNQPIPTMVYSVFKYIIAFNHFENTLTITNNCPVEITDIEANQEINRIHYGIVYTNLPSHQFNIKRLISSSNEAQVEALVANTIKHAKADQSHVLALARTEHRFSGDDFNVYRALRYSNPSPYLYYFEYEDYKMMGSAYEAYINANANKTEISILLNICERNTDGNDEGSLRELKRARNERSHTVMIDFLKRKLNHLGDVNVPTNFLEIVTLSHLYLLVAKFSVKTNNFKEALKIVDALQFSPVHYGFSTEAAHNTLIKTEKEPRGLYGGTLGYISFDGHSSHISIDKAFMCRNTKIEHFCEAKINYNSNNEESVSELMAKFSQPMKVLEFASKI